MGKAVLLSINPPYTIQIFGGEKDIEWRKTPLPLGKHYVYETKKHSGCGKVIGEFDVVSTKTFHRGETVPQSFIERGCVSVGDLRKYAGDGDKARLSANFIDNAVLYGEPKSLHEFYKLCPGYKSDPGRCWECDNAVGEECDCGIHGEIRLTRPPQSWCYVEEL